MQDAVCREHTLCSLRGGCTCSLRLDERASKAFRNVSSSAGEAVLCRILVTPLSKSGNAASSLRSRLTRLSSSSEYDIQGIRERENTTASMAGEDSVCLKQ